ncbi:MAG: hypothetical protein AAF572_09700 [Cyanobacteria bacterium P01_B01_bin.77]
MKNRYLATLGTTITLLSMTGSANAQYLTPDIAASMCTDIVAANQQTDITTTSNNSSSSSANSRYRQAGGGGGVSFMGIGVRGQGQKITRQSNNSARQNSSTRHVDQSSVTHEAVGRNCDAAIHELGATQRTQINAEVNLQLIDSRERVRTQEIETNSQNQLFQMMMQGF